MEGASTTGKVVTFYSYKGGVGRSFALANVAALLARWRYRVLCIDWDIEAPGLDHYFAARGRHKGLVDMLLRWRRGQPLDWRGVARTVSTEEDAVISLIGAGRRDASYFRRTQDLDWRGMYEAGLGAALELMTAEMRAEFDFVLIDSRTGITDFAAIVTAQLPDVLAFMFTANQQSLEGCLEVVGRAVEVRGSMPIAQGALRLLPIPARFEARVEYTIAQKWRARFWERLAPFYGSWLVQGVDHRRIIDLTTIPHVPFWTFGEKLAVVDEGSGGYAPDSISYAIETIGALIARDLDGTDVLEETRDDYVRSVALRELRQRDGSFDVYLSSAQSDRPAAEALDRRLRASGLSLVGSMGVASDHDLPERNFEQIARSQHMVVLVGREWGQWQEAEVRAFRRQSAVDERPRLLLPILLEQDVRVPSSLLNYRTLDMSRGLAMVATDLVDLLIGSSAQS